MSHLTLQQLWNALTPTEKDEACLAFWQSRDPMSLNAHGHVINALASKLRFRKVFVERKSPEDRTRLLLRFIDKADFIKYQDNVLRAWLLSCKKGLLSRFLDVQGLAHENCVIHDNVEPPGEDVLRCGIRVIKEEFSHRETAIYLGLLEHQGDFWDALPEAIDAEGVDLVSYLMSSVEGIKEAEGDEEESAPPEFGPAFTRLDGVVIKTVVASALRQEGSLDRDQVEAFVDEIVELNVDRQKSFFHKGFFHAIYNKPLTFHFAGENEERRLWYFSGVLSGMLRRDADDTCLVLLKENADLTKGLSQNGHLQCGAILLHKPFYDLLLQAKEYALLSRWLQTHLKNIDHDKRVRMLIQSHEDAASLLRSGSPSEALPLLDVVDSAIAGDHNKELPERFAAWIVPLNQRKRAQALQLLGDFTGAEEILRPLVQLAEFEDSANALADLALIKGAFRSLDAILPTGDEKKNIGIRDSLMNGKAVFEQAVERFGSDATNAHFCLGVLKFSQGSNAAAECADHFKQALVGMMKKQDAYREIDLIEWARFLLAVSLLETAETAEFLKAAERIDKAVSAKLTFPLALWKRALGAAVVFDDSSLAEQIAEHLLQCRDNEAYKLIQECSIASHCKEMRNRYLDWLLTERLSFQLRWDELIKLLPLTLKDLGLDQAERILDAMEELAWEHEKYRTQFVELLRDDRNYSPAWGATEAEMALSRLYELAGDLCQAAEVLKGRFHKLRSNGSEYSMQQARLLVDHLQSFKLDDGSLEHLSRLVEESDEIKEASLSAQKRLKEGQEVSILYIGGNETQEAYVDKITKELSGDYPRLHVSFYFPRMDSNWNVHLDKIRPKIGTNNALVLSNLIRTGFGQHVRKLCNDECPWFACTGRGKQSLKNSIEKAAIWACQKKEL